MKVSAWFSFWSRATRVYAISASLVPVIVGSVFAWYEHHQFYWLLFGLTLLAAVTYHLACNLINDYYDHKYQVDRPGTFGGSGMIVSGELSPAQVLRAASLLLAIGSAVGLWLAQACGLPLLYLGFAGLLGLVFYTATPFSAKYQALGEPLVFVMMGPLMVLGSYYVQCGIFSWRALFVSLPIGCLVAAILQANDTRDITDNRKSGIRTASILFGPKGARAFLSSLIFGAYVCIAGLLSVSILPIWCALVVLSLPQAAGIHRLYWSVTEEKSERLLGAVENTAKLHMSFGILLAVGMLLGGIS